jgi:hypothetical protein
MSILLDGEIEPESTCALAARAVELAPEESFYRCLLAENLAEAGEVEASRQQLHYLRLNCSADYSYWRATAALAEAEDDECRYIWALRRARGCRVCPETDRNLAWALYFSGRDAMRSGDLDSSRVLLEEILNLGDSTQVYVQRADSLLKLIDEFQETGSRGH